MNSDTTGPSWFFYFFEILLDDKRKCAIDKKLQKKSLFNNSVVFYATAKFLFCKTGFKADRKSVV